MPYKEARHKIKKPNAQLTRLFIYRVPKMGSIYHPDVFLNGKKIWRSESGVVCMLDITPGRYTLRTSENEENTLLFYAYAGEIKYINFGLRPGNWTGSFMPQLVNETIGELNIEYLDYNECKP